MPLVSYLHTLRLLITSLVVSLTFNGTHNVLVQALTVIIESSFPFTIWQRVCQSCIVEEGTHLNMVSQCKNIAEPYLIVYY